EARVMADGAAIRDYVRETARDFGIDRTIRFHHQALKACWSSEQAQWTVEVRRTDTDETVLMTCSFLFGCTGYYRYDAGYSPEFPGSGSFTGQIVHPQRWPEDLDC